MRIPFLQPVTLDDIVADLSSLVDDLAAFKEASAETADTLKSEIALRQTSVDKIAADVERATRISAKLSDLLT